MTSGQIVGTAGRSLQVEALDLSLLQDTLGGTFQSNAHVEQVGWTGGGPATARSARPAGACNSRPCASG